MAFAKRRVARSASTGWFSSLAAKIAAAFVLCLTVRLLLAQAPAAPDVLVVEETDNQGYKVQKVSETLRKNKALEGKVRSQIVRPILTGQTSMTDPAVRSRFRDYFLSYLFPMMTTEEGLKTIAKDRQDLFRDLLGAKSNDAHREVVDLTLAAMSRIVQDPAYRPAARYNAMLTISNLNDVEPVNLGTTVTLPEPMRTALPIILQQYQKADRDDIRLAALLGLSRHLEWENYKQPPSTPMQPANKAAAVKALSELAEAKAVPAGRDPDVHVWMRRRAIEGLSAYCATKADAEIASLMDRLLKDEADVMSVRLTVAAALGKMSLQPPAKIDALATAKELGYLALVACDAELTRAETQRKAEFDHESRLTGTFSGGGGGGEYGSGYSGGGGMAMPGMMGAGGGTGSLDGGPGGMRQPLRPPPGSQLSGGTGMPGGDGGYGTGYPGEMAAIDPSMQDPKHFRVEYLRRKLRQQIYAVQLGLLGGEDKIPPKTTGSPATPPPTPPTNPAAGGPTAERKEPKGVWAVAGPQKAAVDDVYFKVRKLAEAVEGAGDKAMFHELVKDVRKELKNLELITKRLPPAGAAPGAAIDDDAPSAPAGPVPGGKGKAPPPKAGGPGVPTARPGLPGKSAARPQFRPQPGVFGQPGRGR